MSTRARVWISAEGNGLGRDSEGQGTILLPLTSGPEKDGRISTLVLRDGDRGSSFIPLDRLTAQDPQVYRRIWGGDPRRSPTVWPHATFGAAQEPSHGQDQGQS
jgi:hypothetical protein